MVSWSSVLWERSTERQVWQVVFYGLDIWKRSPKRQTDIFFTTVEVCALVPVCRVICFYTPVVLIPPGAAWGKAVNQGNMSDMMSSKVFGFSVYSVCVCVCGQSHHFKQSSDQEPLTHSWRPWEVELVAESGDKYEVVHVWDGRRNENHWLIFKNQNQTIQLMLQQDWSLPLWVRFPG